ncbi:MAG: triose-phosphate isomerase [Actinomycetota bacterium]|nr:triose-phosphate isomerase [Actinomycetota bacterium]
MFNGLKPKPPFFEIGPKAYLFGDQIVELALAADKASKKYNVDIIFTTPYTEIRRVSEATKNIFVFAPHMDPLPVGRGLADILPEAVKDAGAVGVMLNHCEKPLTLSALDRTIKRAEELDLITIVCADTIAEAKAIACFSPDIIVAEPTKLIATGKTSDMGYVKESTQAIKSVNPEILVLQSAGIKNGDDVYNLIFSGAEATGTSSGVANADNRIAMVDEMVAAVRKAWDDINKK